MTEFLKLFQNHYEWFIIAILSIILIVLIIKILNLNFKYKIINSENTSNLQKILELDDKLQCSININTSQKIELEKANTQCAINQNLINDLRAQLLEQKDTIQEHIQENTSLRSFLGETKARLEEKINQNIAQKTEIQREFSDTIKLLKSEITTLSNDLLAHSTKTLNEQNLNSLSTIINPLKEKFKEFNDEVKKSRDATIEQKASLEKQIEILEKSQISLSDEARKLSNALHNQKKKQGMWGELILEKVLESSGLRSGFEYKREVSIKDDKEQNKRPDAIIYLPNNRNLIIDAKCSLNDFLEYVNTDNEEEKVVFMKRHIEAIKNHIKTLSEREYYKLDPLNSPPLVFMFFPSEAPISEALQYEPTILSDAIKCHIAITTPSTLLSALTIARGLWDLENRNKTTEILIKQIEAIYDKLRVFLETFSKVESSLNQAQNSFEDAKKQLALGKGNIISRTLKIKEIIHNDKNLPKELVNFAQIDNEEN